MDDAMPALRARLVDEHSVPVPPPRRVGATRLEVTFSDGARGPEVVIRKR